MAPAVACQAVADARTRDGQPIALLGLRLAGRGEERWCTGEPGDRQARRETEMPEKSTDDRRLLDERDEAQATATARTCQHIELEGTPHHIRP
jgi:hypothetical protein